MIFLVCSMHEMPRIDTRTICTEMPNNIGMVLTEKLSLIMEFPTKDMGTLFLTPYPKASISIDQWSLPEPAAIETIRGMGTAQHTMPEVVKNIRSICPRGTLPRTKETTPLPNDTGKDRKSLTAITTTALDKNGGFPPTSCGIVTVSRAIDMLGMPQGGRPSIDCYLTVGTLRGDKLDLILWKTGAFFMPIQRRKVLRDKCQFKLIERSDIAYEPANTHADVCPQSPMKMMVAPPAAYMPRTANIEDASILMEAHINGT